MCRSQKSTMIYNSVIFHQAQILTTRPSCKAKIKTSVPTRFKCFIIVTRARAASRDGKTAVCGDPRAWERIVVVVMNYYYRDKYLSRRGDRRTRRSSRRHAVSRDRICKCFALRVDGGDATWRHRENQGKRYKYDNIMSFYNIRVIYSPPWPRRGRRATMWWQTRRRTRYRRIIIETIRRRSEIRRLRSARRLLWALSKRDTKTTRFRGNTSV